MGSLHKFRKAVGALKDSTTVSLAKVNSEFSELDVAIVKATNHVEAPPGERHVRKIFAATSVVSPRADVAYCIHALGKRLNKTRNWMVAIKTCINDSTPHAWDCSKWTRAYALFLEERLECFRILKYDIETEPLIRPSLDETKVHRTRFLESEELLQQLLALQHLMFRLVCCQPEGAACTSYLIQYALSMVLKESFQIYCAINDGIINLVDKYFEMSKYDAVKALHIYKRAGQQADMLSDFYDFCKRLELARNFQFPLLRQPPPSFRATMEEYVREAPPKRLEYHEEDESPHKEQIQEEVQEKFEVGDEKKPELPEFRNLIDFELPLLISTEDDLLGLNEIHPKITELEETNALALAIVQTDGSIIGSDPQSSSQTLSDLGDTTNWELSLVTTPSNIVSHVTESTQAGVFDKLLLDSLYNDEVARRQIELQNAEYQYGNGMTMQNPFEQLQDDPFAMSYVIAPPINIQMTMLSHQQYQMFQQQQMFQQSMMLYHSHNPQQQQHILGWSSSSNPFEDPF